MAIVLRHAVISRRPLSKMADNVDKTDKKTSIDQGLKLLREATDLLSGSLRAIIWENRESHDTRQKIEFFFILPKHPF